MLLKLSNAAFGAVALIPIVMVQPASTQAMPGGMNHSISKDMGGADMKTMMKDLSGKMGSMAMSNNVGVDFAMMMRIHHQGAVDMAEVHLRDDKEPQMRLIAAFERPLAQSVVHPCVYKVSSIN